METISDTYLTIADQSYGEFKDKGSKFMAFAYPFSNSENLQPIIKELKSQHLKARHFCFAYEIGIGDDNFRMSDDGEPSGTAGKPIYGQLKSSKLSNVLMVVVRYFGGVKLGVGGLTQAYKAAAQDCLANAVKVERHIVNHYLLIASYEKMGHLFNVLKKHEIEIVSKSFATEVEVVISLRSSIDQILLLELKADLLELSTEQIDNETEIDWCKISLKEVVHV